MDWSGDVSTVLGGVLADVQTEEVNLRGSSVTVRAMTTAQSEAIDRLYPLPPAPWGQDPNKGGLAAKVQRFDDPAYMARCDELERACGYAKLAAAMADPNDEAFPVQRCGRLVGKPDEARAYFEKCAKNLGLLTRGEKLAIMAAHARLSGTAPKAADDASPTEG